jgi:hypothetical protein
VNGQRPLADRIAAVLAERGPAPARVLALAVGARKEAVLRELHAARRFGRVGRGRYTVWQVAGTAREPLHGRGGAGYGPDVALAVLDRLAAVEARLAAIEARLPHRDDPAAGTVPVAGQVTVDEAIAANGEAATR